MNRYYEREGLDVETVLRTADNITHTGLPREKASTVWVSLKSDAGIDYKLIHVFQHTHGPYILLASKVKNLTDFNRVRSCVAHFARGTFNESISPQGKGLCSVIQTPTLTPRLLTKNVEGYRSIFPDTRIVTAYYENVTKKDLRKAKVPLIER